MLVSIVIPFYNHFNLTHQCLLDLHRYVTKKDVEIILVNDASTDDVSGTVSWWQKTVTGGHTIRYVQHETNMGFGKSMNDGCKMANGNILVLLSNDVRVSGDFIPLVLEALSDPKTLVGGEFLNHPTGWNEFEMGGLKGFVPYCNGWFLALTKSAWVELGGFDSIYGKFDFEDVDLSATALSLGYNLVGLNTKLLHHIGGQTVNTVDPKRQETTIRNRQLFISKWGDRMREILCQT